MRNKLKNTTVYLCGAVEAIPDGGADWRDAITKPLNEMGVRVWNPLIKPDWYNPKYDAKDQVEDKKEIVDAITNNTFPVFAFDRLNKLRNTCLRLADACDFIICKLGGKTVGTFEELAIRGQKPVLFIGEFDSTWRYVQFSQPDPFFFKDVDMLLDYLRKVDSGVEKVDALSWVFLKNHWTGEPS